MKAASYVSYFVALFLTSAATHAELTWNTGSGSVFTEGNWTPSPVAGSVDPLIKVSEDLFVGAGTASFSLNLYLGSHRLRIGGGSVTGSNAGISADGNASDIKGGLVMEGGTLDVEFLEDITGGLSGDAQLILRSSNPFRKSFIELASPDCSIRFVGMGKSDARAIVNLRCSMFGLQAVENLNYRLVTSGADTILQPYGWIWTGAGAGISLYQGANWDTNPDTSGTQAGITWSSNKRAPATLYINSGNLGGGGFSGDINLYRYNIYMTGGKLKAKYGGGITWGVNARNERNPMHVSGGTVEVDWLRGVELHLSGSGRVVLHDEDEALDNAVVVLSGTGAAIEFTQSDYMQIISYYLPMIDTDAGPAEMGVNVCLSPLSGGGYRLKRILDSDNDDMDDTWETDWTGGTTTTGSENTDDDGLNLHAEFLAGTRPDLADTDGDGLNDDVETLSNPLKVDTDNDGISDGDETSTNPGLADTDGDGFKDGGELRRGTDPQNNTERPSAPNVILVLVDDAGWGELGVYGNTEVKTPQLDSMASQGLRFTDAYTNGCVCAPTRYSLMVGRHTGRAELRSWNVRMRTGDTSLGTMMRDAGYYTGVFGKWAIGDAGNGGMPHQNGFDHFYGIVDHQEGHRHYHRYLWKNDQRVFYNPFTAWEHGASSLDLVGSGNPGTMSGDLEVNRGNAHSHDLTTKELFSWITTHKDDAFFACWHPILPHGPLQESAHPSDLTDGDGVLADTSQRSMINFHYDSASLTNKQKIRASQMSSIDHDMGRLITLLGDLNIDDNTIILFTSDNGADQSWAQDTALKMVGNLRGWKFNLYEGGIRVPFIAWGKGVPVNHVSTQSISLDDLMPTIAELGKASQNPLTSGRSLVPLLNGTATTMPDRPLYWEWSGNSKWTRAVRFGAWKLLRFRSTATPVTVTYELYNVVSDPTESSDVSATNPGIVDQLERIMDDPFYHDVGFENFRSTDEFRVTTGDGNVAKGTIGAILDAGMTAWSPLANDLDQSASFSVRFILDTTESGAFELTDEAGTTFLGFTVDRSTSQVTMTSGENTVSGVLPVADADGAWTASVDWNPGGTCKVTVGNLVLQQAAPSGLNKVTKVRHRSLSGSAEFSSFKLHLSNTGKGAHGASIDPHDDSSGITVRQILPTLPGSDWEHYRSETLMPDSWELAQVLYERRNVLYGSMHELETFFPAQETTDVMPPERRFYRSVMVAP